MVLELQARLEQNVVLELQARLEQNLKKTQKQQGHYALDHSPETH